MITEWTKNLESKDKASFEAQVQSAKPVLERMKEILDELRVQINASENKSYTYDTANWAYLQAHRNGYRECLDKIDTLLTLT